jgi:hypothetical protein
MAQTAALLLTAASSIVASVPPGIVRGDLLECEIAEGKGELSVRTTSHEVFRFTFDPKTYFERGKERVEAGVLRPGDLVEVVSDELRGSLLRYARTVHVLDRGSPTRRRPSSLSRLRPWRSTLDSIFPRGNLTFAGIVSRLDGDAMVLRTRNGGEQVILLREDTRYLENGMEVEGSALALSLRVFVRASKNFENDIEAHQVVWGEILAPAPR